MPLKRCVVTDNYLTALLKNEALNKPLMFMGEGPFTHSSVEFEQPPLAALDGVANILYLHPEI